MLVSPLKIALFLAGGSAAALTTAYVTGAFDGMFSRPPAMVAALPDPAVSDGGREGSKPAAPAASPDTRPSTDEVPAAGAAVSPGDVVPPSFDIVRVEPDGSVVIAGQAAAGSAVDILVGTRVIASTVATPDGDFAVVLDEPLQPGDYQLVLRSTTTDNVAATSLETAVVSIPDDETGQVLALVEEPGQPSRLITVPDAPAAATASAQETGQGTPAADSAAKPRREVPSTPAEAGGTDATKSAEAPKAADETPVAGTDGAGAEQTSDAVADEATSDEPAAQNVARAEPTTETKATDPAAARPAPDASGAAAQASEPRVLVEAVEIEGRSVFVAGSGEPGLAVRVYANDELLGEAQVSPSGRFLVETERDLAVGDYIIRADLLDDGGRKVVARAAVPFQREEGQAVSAVADPHGQDRAAGAAEGAAGQDAAAPGETADAGQSSSAKAGDATLAATSPVAEVLAPKLRSVDGAVIIRRGDTLWRISRRVYGRGIRYSTIYLANQEQIEDPDRIWPGQVFRVPDKSREGEAADLKSMGDQMTTVEAGDKKTTVE